MKRPSRESIASKASCGCPDAEFATKYKSIAEYLSTAVWDDGKTRELSSLTVCIAGEGIQVALNDKALSRSCYSTAGTLEEALQLLDDVLAEDKAPWRQWKKQGSGR